MKSVFRKIFTFLIVFFFLQIILAYFVIQFIVIKETRMSLGKMADRVTKDLKYDKQGWDTSMYDADPETPYPNGSSGFTDPLYILSIDGFVIERNKPIAGFLDSSDFKSLLLFEKPTTVKEIVNENWQVLSLPIVNNSSTEGVVFVSYYGIKDKPSESINTILFNSAQSIRNQVRFINGKIDVSRVDVRNIHYEVSFEIVDKHNIVLINNGRTPSLIDRSYVAAEINNLRERIIKDRYGESYFVVSKQIRFSNEDIGLVIVARSLKNIYGTLWQFIIYSLILNFVFILPCAIGLLIFLERQSEKQLLTQKQQFTKEVKKLKFDSKSGSIRINDQDLLRVPLYSNQYYLVDILLSKPGKKFSQDQILEKFGEELNHDSWRKVYDAMLAINKKLGIKLITYQDKMYSLNSTYLPFVSRI